MNFRKLSVVLGVAALFAMLAFVCVPSDSVAQTLDGPAAAPCVNCGLASSYVSAASVVAPVVNYTVTATPNCSGSLQVTQLSYARRAPVRGFLNRVTNRLAARRVLVTSASCSGN